MAEHLLNLLSLSFILLDVLHRLILELLQHSFDLSIDHAVDSFIVQHDSLFQRGHLLLDTLAELHQPLLLLLNLRFEYKL